MAESRLLQLAREAALRRADPLRGAYATLTARQRSFVVAPNQKRVAEGGNRSGKTWTNIIDMLLQARGIHPARAWRGQDAGWESWIGWYATESYEMFGLQGWKHFKKLLLYAGESELQLPTRNILRIGWNTKSPQIPNYIAGRRRDGRLWEFFIKSYEQGADAFASGTADCLGLDEESTDDIWNEGLMRVVDRSGCVNVSATPTRGRAWLARLREDAESFSPSPSTERGPGGEDSAADVFHVRFPMYENPILSADAIEQVRRDLRGNEALLKLRLEGFPLAAEGMVYPDDIFTAAHVCNPFNIPSTWALFRSIDYGFYNTSCVWIAVSPNEDQIVLYRDYLGQERRISENANAIAQASGGERYVGTWIDPATLGVDGNTGRRVIDLFDESGLPCTAAIKGEVMAGLEEVWKLLAAKVEAPGAGERPRFRVFRGCEHFLKERRAYRFKDARPAGDTGSQNPVKRDDHIMDAWRYAVTTGLHWEPAPGQPAPKDKASMAYKFWKKRKENQ